MPELDISLMAPEGQSLPYIFDALRLFERENGVRVNVQVLPWRSGRSQLINYAMFRSGPDISEIGSTWLSNFVVIDALQPVSETAVEAVGGEDVFIPASWRSGQLNSQVWSVPLTVDVRSVYYRRDLLAKAGINSADPFHLNVLPSTLEKLNTASGVMPWHNGSYWSSLISRMAPWVWAKGGRFISDDGRRPLFTSPATMAGIFDYFHMQRPFMPRDIFDRSVSNGNALFYEGEIAALVSGYWTWRTIQAGRCTPEVFDNVGVALPPGYPYVGGSGLVIWKYSPRVELALALIKFLTSFRVQRDYLQAAGVLSPRLDILDMLPVGEDENLAVIKQCLLNGRSLQSAYLWGLIEDKINIVIRSIWRSLFTNPSLNLARLVEQRFEALARQIEQNLANF